MWYTRLLIPIVYTANQSKQAKSKMNFKSICAVLLMVAVFMIACVSAEAYRKPPFNGSIFGKRNSPVPEYDNPKQSIYTMCQIASEACQTWFPTVALEKK